MKKFLWLAFILILALCVELCGCENLSPWSEKDVQINVIVPQIHTVYVCGAVENEGYYRVKEGDTYLDAISQAGLITQSILSPNFNTIVTDEQLAIVVHYTENNADYECINVNSVAFLLDAYIPNVPDNVISKIAEYRRNYGKIHNNAVLKSILGEDYDNNHYKLYVAEADYEEIH